MPTQLAFVQAMCTCCAQPAALLPRPDLPGSLAVCPNTGQAHRLVGERWVAAHLPLLDEVRAAPNVRIDLSRAGYA
jgi:hypothetical protein